MNRENTWSSAASTKAKLLAAAREEFFQKGYKQASLRNICSSCGVTTGALYFFFQGKDDLYRAVVDPVVRQWENMTRELVEKEKRQPCLGRDCDRAIMEFELKYRKEILILMEKASGSSLEDFREKAFNNLIGYFTDFFTMTLGRQPDPAVIRLLAGIRFESNLNILKGDYPMEQALFLNDVLACYADGGFHAIAENFKTTL